MAPPPPVRDGLAKRAASISAWFSPAGVEGIKPHVDLVLGTLRLRDETVDDADMRQRAYYLALCILPLFAVVEACAKALRGEIGDCNGRFAPQPGEICAAARRHMRQLEREQADIDMVLRAEVLDPPKLTREQRAAAVERARGMLKETADNSEPFPRRQAATDARSAPQDRRIAEEALDRVAERLRTPLSVSPDLAAKIAGMSGGASTEHAESMT